MDCADPARLAAFWRLARGGSVPGVIFHTDQGSEYWTGPALRGYMAAIGKRCPAGGSSLGPGSSGVRDARSGACV